MHNLLISLISVVVSVQFHTFAAQLNKTNQLVLQVLLQQLIYIIFYDKEKNYKSGGAYIGR